MNFSSDTIAAISTPPGNSGIAVVRISGADSITIADSFFKGKRSLKKITSHKAIYGKFYDGDQLLDEVVITIFHHPHSYTGEDVVEISCHGNMYIVNRILEALLTRCRLAEKGEFTQRAFINNKMDLTEAEAVGDLLNAKTKFSHFSALEQLEGSLRNKIEKYLKKLTEFRTLLELEIDFSDQDLPFTKKNELKIGLQTLINDLQKLVLTGKEGIILREGLKVSLTGPPNVGKSSIFNAFLQTERAIVTPVPGTTRDYLEEAISLEGYYVRIFDTAGLRTTDDEVEQIGIQRSYDIIRNSHLILFIIDGEEDIEEYEKLTKIASADRILKVVNKSDLLENDKIQYFEERGYIIVSALSKNGLPPLKSKIIDKIKISEKELHSGILTNVRQISVVKRAIESLKLAESSLEDDVGVEFTAFDLQEASSALEEVIGKITSDDILQQIFADFCIGK